MNEVSCFSAEKLGSVGRSYQAGIGGIGEDDSRFVIADADRVGRQLNQGPVALFGVAEFLGPLATDTGDHDRSDQKKCKTKRNPFGRKQSVKNPKGEHTAWDE